MGTPDSVKVPCPKCGAVEYFQSKGGDCLMETYELADAPEDVLANVNRHSPIKCFECNTLFYVDEEARAAKIWNHPPPPQIKSVNWFYDIRRFYESRQS